MENKNHPAEKLMQYPINSDSEDIPKTVVRNPELAEELAYAEKPYQELALESEDDEAAAILRRGRAAVQRMGIESEYYNSYDTTRAAVKKAIEKDDLAWLNPNHGSELAMAKHRARQERDQAEFERDQLILADQRRYVRALANDEAVQRKVGEYNQSFAGYSDGDSKNFKRVFTEVPEYDPHSYGQEVFSNRNLKEVFLKKRRNAFNALLAANSWRTVADSESLRKPVRAVDEELNMFFKEVQGLYESGVVDELGAMLVLSEFNNARYSVDDFRAVAEGVRTTFANGNFYDKTTNVEELLEGLYSSEPRESIVAERVEWTAEREQKDAEQREKSKAYNKQKSEQDKAVKEAKEASRRLEIKEKFEEIQADFVEGRNTTKQKILESPVGADVAPLMEADLSNGLYEATYPSVRALKAALALFTVRRSEEFPEEGHLVPYTKLDIDALWREKFVRPKGYYGGETGKAHLVIRKATDDESKEAERQLRRLDETGREEAFVVDITVEGVKSGEVQMTSTLEGLLFSVPDVTLPLVRRFAYRPLESSATGDTSQYELDRLAAISRARRQTGEAMANPLRGGLPGLGSKR